MSNWATPLRSLRRLIRHCPDIVIVAGEVDVSATPFTAYLIHGRSMRRWDMPDDMVDRPARLEHEDGESFFAAYQPEIMLWLLEHWRGEAIGRVARPGACRP